MYVIKRNKTEVEFDSNKIFVAVSKANKEVEPELQINDAKIHAIAETVKEECEKLGRAINIEEIQDMVEREIMKMSGFEVAQKYVRYRYQRNLKRKANTTDDGILSLLDNLNEEATQENANKNPIVNSTQRDYMAGEVSRDLTERILLSDDIVQAHKEGIIHFHDSDYYAQHMYNCCLINLEDMLQNGTVISGTMIEKPHRLRTACNVATQIIAQVASNQYGGQTFSLAHLAPFVDISRQRIRKNVMKEREQTGEAMDETIIEKIVKSRLAEEIKDGIQTIQYQIITLMTCNGQAPFVTMFMYLNEVPEGQTRDDLALLIEEVLKQRIQGVKNEAGIWISPTFPKLIYVLEDNNMEKETPYFYLTELAAKCTAKRMVPDYISEKIMMEEKGDTYPCMGCRSFLTADTDECNKENKANAKNYVPGTHKYYGRFNQGVVTINLVDVACSSGRDMEKFWEIFNERLELCHKALRMRHERLLGTPSDVAPILWQHGAIARLASGEKIDKLLYGNYSTISLGYAGLYEMCMYMTGKSHTDPDAKPFALSVMQHMNDMCGKWRAEENISYSIYGTPMESTTYKFAKCLQKRFGMIKDVTDHIYITNSYHVNVREEITAFQKLSFESEFQKLSPGGAISYVEIPNMQKNLDAVLAIMRHIWKNIMYAELNTKSDYCEDCGFDGEIKLVDDGNGKLVWECPNCGNRNPDHLVVVRRVCGYLGVAQRAMNQGRLSEINQRCLHISTKMV